jgi:hypothetical protein
MTEEKYGYSTEEVPDYASESAN